MNKEKNVELLQKAIQINTENGNEEELAKFYQKLLQEHDIPSKLVSFSEGRSSLVAEISNGKGKTIALSGHLDVVSAGNPDSWSHPPFLGEIKNDVIWGRGTSDMKSGLTAMFLAFIALKESQNFKGTIKLIATVGEEIGELGSKQLTELGYMKDVDALLIGEPCNVGIAYAHKGSLNYKVVSKGVTAHSSTPELGVNAIENLNEAMERISKIIKEKAVNHQNQVLGTTFHNITIVNGGTQVNSLPDDAYFEANARTVPEFDNGAVMKEVKEILDALNKKEGVDLTYEVTADQPPVETNPNSELIQAIMKVANQVETLMPQSLFQSMSEVMGVDLTKTNPKMAQMKEIHPIVISGTTDAAQFKKGNPNLELAVYGPGVPMLNHKIDERLPLSQYFDFIKAYQGIVEEYLSK